MDTYQQNLEILKKRYPHLVSRLKENRASRFSVVASRKQDLPTILGRDERGDFYLHSLYDPLGEAARMIKQIPISRLSSLWIMGTGMGYHIMELLNIRHQGFMTIIIETDPALFDIFLHTSVATHALEWPYFVFVTGTREMIAKDLEVIMQSKVNFHMGQPQVLMTPGFERYDGTVYHEILTRVFNYTKHRYTNLGNSVEDTLDGLDNSFNNIAVMCQSPGVRQLENQYKGLPAIIVGAGPSLDKNIDLLSEAKGRALIMACDTTLPVLLKKNIVPDMVMTIERIPEVYERFYKNVEVPPEVWLVALNVADPRIFNKFSDHHLLAVRATEPLSLWIDKVLERKGNMVTGLSVSHLAFSTAHILGCEPIVLIGQDLALAEDGRYYVRGGFTEDGKEDISGEAWVKDYQGREIKTTYMLKVFHEWFEMALRDGLVHCIDATEGGAFIEGTEIMTLREVLERYCAEDKKIVPFGENIRPLPDIPIEQLLQETRGLKEDFDFIYDLILDSIEKVAEVKQTAQEDLRKAAVEGQNLINEVLTNISFRGRVGFTLQAVTTTVMTRLSSWGQLQDEKEMLDFLDFTEHFYKDLKQTIEICLMHIDKIIAKIRTEKEKMEHVRQGTDVSHQSA